MSETPYQPPEESVFDEDGNVIEYGAKFYTPFEELAIMPVGSDKWISGKEFLEQSRGSELEDDAESEEPIPVSDEDLTFWPYGR